VTCPGPRGHRNAGGATLTLPLGQTSTHQQKTQLPTLFAVKTTLAKKIQQVLTKMKLVLAKMAKLFLSSKILVYKNRINTYNVSFALGAWC
jgi:hypothetical protein